jgi:hypothetical protein
VDRSVLSAFAAPAASTTDAAVVAAVAGKRIRVVSFVLNQGDTTASTVTFNSKGAGAGTAIGPALKAAANGAIVAPFADGGWFQTNVGEGLSVTTGAGSTTAVMVTYILVAG